MHEPKLCLSSIHLSFYQSCLIHSWKNLIGSYVLLGGRATSYISSWSVRNWSSFHCQFLTGSFYYQLTLHKRIIASATESNWFSASMWLLEKCVPGIQNVALTANNLLQQQHSKVIKPAKRLKSTIMSTAKTVSLFTY